MTTLRSDREKDAARFSEWKDTLVSENEKLKECIHDLSEKHGDDDHSCELSDGGGDGEHDSEDTHETGDISGVGETGGSSQR